VRVVVAYAFTVGAAALAWMIARRRVEHRSFALLLSIGLAVDVARYGVRVLLAPLLGAAPLEGWARAAGHVDEALFLAWPASLAAASLVTFVAEPNDDLEHQRRTVRVLASVAATWLLAVVALVVTYPITRGGILARYYLAAELGAIVVGIGSIATWIPARRAPEIWHVSIALVVVAEFVDAIVGPWRVGIFGSWSLGQLVHALLCALLIVLQGGLLWMLSSSSPR
jgi:hypothetical protein